MTPHIYRRTFGSGPRPVLAIHCSLAHSGAWRGMGEALTDIATLHAYDLPNHGKSGDWDGQGVMHDTATDMALAMLDDIGPVDVIGHSFGATVALRLAIEHPTRIRSFVMFEPVYFAPVMADDPEFGPRYARDTAACDEAMQVGDKTAAARAFNATWGDTAAWNALPEASRTYMAERIHFVRDSTSFLVEDSAKLLAPGRFAHATGRGLLMRGQTSPWAKEVNAAIARRLPNVEEVALPDLGHMAPVTHPGVVADHVRAFLEAR